MPASWGFTVVSNRTILIIDDEEGMRIAVRTVLESEGYTVVEAANGDEGLAAAIDLQPDLILCDIEMPNKDGFAVLQALRERLAAPVPFIFLTGRSARTDMRKGMNLGADDFLTKPFTAGELRQAVATRMKRRESLGEEAEQRMEELRQNISASVPHELRTPLTGILGFAGILEEQAAALSPEEILQLARHITESGKRLQSTLEKFWTYAEVAVQSRDPNKRESLRREIFHEADAFVRVFIREKAREHGRESDLTLDLAPRITARISDSHLARVLEEIVENAFMFSERGTPVTVMLVMENGLCRITVEDRGRGMDREQIESIGGFMQFNRRYHEQQGLGLGLSIAREIASIYGGELNITSTKGRGTTVTVKLPAE